jgi:hypothetical protein
VFDINPEATGVTARDTLLYFYYGGLLLTGLKNFPKALIFFKMVRTININAFGLNATVYRQ